VTEITFSSTKPTL